MSGWIGVDLDGTLAKYDGWQGELNIGEPIPNMVNRVKDWLEKGREIRIFTARAYNLTIEGQKAIEDWCLVNLGQVLPITNIKDYGMVELWDDRVVQVIPNTGNPVQSV